MSSFFGRAMILLLVVDLSRSFASKYHDKVTDTEYEVISVKKKKFLFVSKLDITPFEASSVTKFEQSIAVSCSSSLRIQNGSFLILSHIRIYEDRYPFSLLFVISMDDIGFPFDMAWNKKTRNLFVMSRPTGVWQVKWEDHLVKKFSCPPVAKVGFISLTNEGQVLIIEEDYGITYICNINGTPKRNAWFVKNISYSLNATFGRYSFQFAYYDPRWNYRKGYNPVYLHLSEMKDFSLESILDVNGTSERNVPSAIVKRFSFFMLSYVPEKCNEFDVFKVRIERRSKIDKHFEAGYSSLDESLIDEFYSNRGDRLYYYFPVTRCFVPRDSGDSRAVSKESILSISYYFDSGTNQLIAALSNVYHEDQELFILLLQ